MQQTIISSILLISSLLIAATPVLSFQDTGKSFKFKSAHMVRSPLLVTRQSSGGSAGGSDFCSGYGVTCESCFGAGWIDCPDEVDCYNPNDPESYCPSDSGSGTGDSGDSGSSGNSGGSGISNASGITPEMSLAIALGIIGTISVTFM